MKKVVRNFVAGIMVLAVACSMLAVAGTSEAKKAIKFEKGKVWQLNSYAKPKFKKTDFSKVYTKKGTVNLLKNKKLAKGETLIVYGGKNKTLKKTNRGISLGASFSKVQKKYGTVTAIDAAGARENIPTIQDGRYSGYPDAEKTIYKKVKKTLAEKDMVKFADYQCDWTYGNFETILTIRFYMNDKDKVTGIVYMRGYKEV